MVDINLRNAIAVLKQAIDQQILIYKEVLNISIEQEKAIEESNEIQLMQYVEVKNDLMTKAQQIQSNAQPFREYWDQHLQEIDFGTKEEMRLKVVQLTDLIKSVLANDEKVVSSAMKLQQEKNEINQQKTNLRKLKSAYGNAPKKDQFIDKSK